MIPQISEPPAPPMTLAQRRSYSQQIRQIRESKGWSRPQLADASDVSADTIKGIEYGSAGNEETLLKLFDALDVEPTTFGLMSSWMANMLGVLAPVAAKVPRERLPEAMAAVMQILGRAARGKEIPSLGIEMAANVIAGDAHIEQTINPPGRTSPS